MYQDKHPAVEPTNSMTKRAVAQAISDYQEKGDHLYGTTTLAVPFPVNMQQRLELPNSTTVIFQVKEENKAQEEEENEKEKIAQEKKETDILTLKVEVSKPYAPESYGNFVVDINEHFLVILTLIPPLRIQLPRMIQGVPDGAKLELRPWEGQFDEVKGGKLVLPPIIPEGSYELCLTHGGKPLFDKKYVVVSLRSAMEYLPLPILLLVAAEGPSKERAGCGGHNPQYLQEGGTKGRRVSSFLTSLVV